MQGVFLEFVESVGANFNRVRGEAETQNKKVEEEFKKTGLEIARNQEIIETRVKKNYDELDIRIQVLEEKVKKVDDREVMKAFVKEKLDE